MIREPLVDSGLGGSPVLRGEPDQFWRENSPKNPGGSIQGWHCPYWTIVGRVVIVLGTFGLVGRASPNARSSEREVPSCGGFTQFFHLPLQCHVGLLDHPRCSFHALRLPKNKKHTAPATPNRGTEAEAQGCRSSFVRFCCLCAQAAGQLGRTFGRRPWMI